MAPIVLFSVPTNATGLDWEGDVQARIVITELSTSELTTSSPKSISNTTIAINPIYSAIALFIFKENNFDLFAFGQAITEKPDESLILLGQFNTILNSIDAAKISDTLQIIVASWGTSSTGSNIFSTSLFVDYEYSPRATFTQTANLDHLFIEVLGVKFGTTNIAQKILDNLENNTITSSNLLLDKGFQEGFIFTMYSLKKYQPFLNIKVILQNYLAEPISFIEYESSLQKIISDLVAEEIGFDKSEEEIRNKIKAIIAIQDIPFP